MLNNLTAPRQLRLPAKWLKAEGHPVFVTEWNSSALMKVLSKAGKTKNAPRPMTFSLLPGTGFAETVVGRIEAETILHSRNLKPACLG